MEIPVACSFSSTTTDGSYSDTIVPGNYVDNLGSNTAQVFCNDQNGFSVYAVGYSGNEYGNNELINADPDVSNIVTGTATSGSTSNWAMKLTAVTSAISGNTEPYAPTILSDTNGSFASFHAIPSTYTKVVSFTPITDDVVGSKFQTTYAVYIAHGQTAGTYTGKVRYVLVHPATGTPIQSEPQVSTSGTICYYANTTMAEGTMGCQTVGETATSATLIASNFNLNGYGFAGWSDAYDYETNPNAHFYGPNETITFTAGEYTGNNPGLSLYAVWVPSAGNLQDSAKVSELCGTGAGSLTQVSYDSATGNISASLSSVSALTDIRDNQTYAIAKLSDGKCWIIENLRTSNSATLTIANTNNPLNDGTNVTIKHNSSDSTTYNTLSAGSNPKYWCISFSSECLDQSEVGTDNTVNRPTYTSGQIMSSNDYLYSYGNYYNWYSATAGRGQYITTDYATGDLCPAGWRIPSGPGTGEFGQLTNSLGGYRNGDRAYNMDSTTNPTGAEMSLRIRHFPNNLVYSSNVGGSITPNNRGTYGHLWTVTSYTDGERAYTLNFTSSTVSPAGIIGRYFGRAIRCVIKSNS